MSAQTLPGQGPGSELSDWAGSPLSTLHAAAAMTQPIRIEEFPREGRYVVRFELPGIDPEHDLEVSIEAQVLTVHAEWPVGAAGKYHTEFRYGLFCSHVTLPAGIDDSDVRATYENGILEVSVGFEGAHSARKINVVTAGTAGSSG
jgi:HSP20 family protein